MRTKFLLYSHKHRYQKMGEKTHETIFPETHEYVRAKMVGKKSSQKFSKKKFYIHTNNVTKKWWGKNARFNFSRNKRMVRAKMLGKKIGAKKCKKFFLHSDEYR